MIFLDNISSYFTFLPIVGLILLLVTKPYAELRQFVIYLTFAAAVQLTVMLLKKEGNNLWIFHIYTPIETFLLLSLLLRFIKNEHPYILAAIFSVQAIILDVCWGDLAQRDIYPGFVEYTSLTIVSISALKFLKTDFRYYITIGIAFYAVPNLVTYSVFAIQDLIPLSIHSISNITMNIFFLTGIICYYKAEIPYIKFRMKHTRKMI